MAMSGVARLAPWETGSYFFLIVPLCAQGNLLRDFVCFMPGNFLGP